VALPYKLSLQLTARQGLEVGPRVAKREEGEKEGERHLSSLTPFSLIDEPSLSNPSGLATMILFLQNHFPLSLYKLYM